jgi:hypothetical protein
LDWTRRLAGYCRFLVLPKYEIADGYGLVTPKGKPVYRADPQRTLGPLDQQIRRKPQDRPKAFVQASAHNARVAYPITTRRQECAIS